MNKRRYFFILMIFISSSCFSQDSCELTGEYKALRTEAIQIVYGDENSYKKCLNAAHQDEYWRALSACEEEGKGVGVGGGCAHLVGRKTVKNPAEISHCKVFYFKPSKELVMQLLTEEADYKKVKKCK